ncbi:Immune-associated nucleotide-binding protein 8 [Bulinus truncatus]|nr:Immune-associated nucleotide-binding protein 8 [Bulinus truncatus]
MCFEKFPNMVDRNSSRKPTCTILSHVRDIKRLKEQLDNAVRIKSTHENEIKILNERIKTLNTEHIRTIANHNSRIKTPIYSHGFQPVGELAIRSVIQGEVAIHSVIQGEFAIHSVIQGGVAIHSVIQGEFAIHSVIQGGVAIHSVIPGEFAIHSVIQGGVAIHSVIQGEFAIHSVIQGGVAIHSVIEGGVAIHSVIQGGVAIHSVIQGGVAIHSVIQGGVAIHSVIQGGVAIHSVIQGGVAIHSVIPGELAINILLYREELPSILLYRENQPSILLYREELPSILLYREELPSILVFKSKQQCVDLVLVGRIAAGKSALGNSILRRRNAFESKQSTNLVTKEVTCQIGEYEGRNLHVFDCPGLRARIGQYCQEFIQTIFRRIRDRPNAKTVVLIVIDITSKATFSCSGIIAALKNNFGDHFVQNHCITVFTGGDHFQNYQANNGVDLNNWCFKQSGEIAVVLHECNYRFTIFDNRTTNTIEQEHQLRQLFQLIDLCPD